MDSPKPDMTFQRGQWVPGRSLTRRPLKRDCHFGTNPNFAKFSEDMVHGTIEQLGATMALVAKLQLHKTAIEYFIRVPVCLINRCRAG